MEQSVREEKKIRMSEILFIMVDHYKLLLSIMAIAFVLSFGFFYHRGVEAKHDIKNRNYMSTMEVYVSSPLGTGSYITYSDILTSDDVLDKIIKDNNLKMTREELWDGIFVQMDQQNTLKVTYLAKDRKITNKIIKGIERYGIPKIEESVPGAAVKIIKNSGSVKKVHTNIEPSSYNEAYLNVKGLSSTAVQDWDTYMKQETNVFGMFKKSIVISILLALIAYMVLVVSRIFSRKLRYPDDFEYVTGKPVIATISKSNQNAEGVLKSTGNIEYIKLVGVEESQCIEDFSKELKTAAAKLNYKTDIGFGKSIAKNPILPDNEKAQSIIIVVPSGKVDEEALIRFEKLCGEALLGFILEVKNVKKYERYRFLGTYWEN